MGVSKRSKDVRARDMKIIQLWNMHLPQETIAEMVGVSQATVSRAIDRVLERYTTINVDEYHAKQAAMFADLHATVLPQIKRGNIKAIKELDTLDQAMARHIPGGVMPTKQEVTVSVDEDTSKALDLIASNKARGVVEEPEEKTE